MQKRTHLGRALTTGLALALVASVWAAILPAGSVTALAASAPAGGKVFLGYWAKWGNSTRPDASLAGNLDRINLWSPYWYTLRADGTLSSREANHASLTSMVHKAGQKVIPLINKTSSNTPLLDAATRQRAVENIYNMLVSNGFDGVNIDFEGMDASTRWGVTAFMRELAARLRPAGLLVTMAVPAKWSADDSINSFAACFDYAALGAVVDYLVIMTYDQHAAWSGPGPVAGADWTDSVIRYALTVVPAGKILLGLAGYGYDWSWSGTTEVDAWSAPARAADTGAAIQWDDTAQEPHFTYWTASGVRHDVWYENSYSVDFKIDQVNRYGLAGVALWALGQEDSRFWQVIRGQAGFSGGLGAPTAAGGRSSTASSPPLPVGAGSTATNNPPGPAPQLSAAPRGSSSSGVAPVFADVAPTYWAYEAIMRLVAAKVVSGVDANHFEPERAVDRAEFAAMLARALALPAPKVPIPVLQDVKMTDWFYDAVNRAVAAGYMSGVGPGLFGPGRDLTRQEAAAVAARVGAALPARNNPNEQVYADVSSIAAWAVGAVIEATAKGLVQGYPDGTFRPLAALTRAQAAVLIVRLGPGYAGP